jgi:HD superfamily phosphodiesterase
MRLFSVINYAFNYVIKTSKLLNIDESHALRHSIEVYHFANEIYKDELNKHPYLKDQKDIIMCSAILHDMCDKKYMNEHEGIQRMNHYLTPYVKEQELCVMNQIISTMSYSTVKKKGYPELDSYNMAYHIVREADLLAAYDVERCIIYQMMHEETDYVNSIQHASNVFENRIFKYIEDQLFITDYSNRLAPILEDQAKIKFQQLNELYNDLL